MIDTGESIHNRGKRWRIRGLSATLGCIASDDTGRYAAQIEAELAVDTVN